MEDILKTALEFSNFQSSLSVKRRLLKEKLDAGLTLGYSGGIFKIDSCLITFVHILIEKGRLSGIPLIDSNGTPVVIDDLAAFQNIILDRYFSSINEYQEKIDRLKKARSVEKLLDL